MGQPSLLEYLPDPTRLVVLLRIAGWTNTEIAEFTGWTQRQVRYETERVTELFPTIVDLPPGGDSARFLRLAYALGLNDAGVPVEEIPDHLAALRVRSAWLRDRQALSRPTTDQPDTATPGGRSQPATNHPALSISEVN